MYISTSLSLVDASAHKDIMHSNTHTFVFYLKEISTGSINPMSSQSVSQRVLSRNF